MYHRLRACSTNCWQSIICKFSASVVHSGSINGYCSAPRKTKQVKYLFLNQDGQQMTLERFQILIVKNFQQIVYCLRTGMKKTRYTKIILGKDSVLKYIFCSGIAGFFCNQSAIIHKQLIRRKLCRITQERSVF